MIKPRIIHAPDRIGITAYNDTGFVVARPTEAHSAWLQTRIKSLPDKISGRYTNISAGIKISLDLLERVPRGILKRVWLLSDGYANYDVHEIMPQVGRAYTLHTNINCIGFGDAFDEKGLRAITAGTHKGKFYTARSLLELNDAFAAVSHEGPSSYHHRAECTILCVDCSGSMTQPMGDRRRIDVVVQSSLNLLAYKQAVYS
jgi:Mg-chelatase subunit ChlD